MKVSDVVIVAVIAAVPPTISSLATLRATTKSAEKIDTLEKNTNSIKDALVKSTRDEALLEGHEKGRIAGRAEEKQDAKSANVRPVTPNR